MKLQVCAVSRKEPVSHPGCDGSVLLSFGIDHPDPSALEHALHLLRGGRGGKVHILRPPPRQQVADGASSYPQLMMVLHKQLWQDRLTGVKQQINGVQEQTPSLETLKTTTGQSCSPANPLSPSVNRDWNSLVFSCIVKSLLQQKPDRAVKCEFNNVLHICKNSKKRFVACFLPS